MILQWNCRGLRKNLHELQILITLYAPLVLCIQESFLPHVNSFNLRGFVGYHFTNESNNHPIGGASVFVRNDIPHKEIQIQSCLQVKAVKITLHKTITICSIYIPPHQRISENDLNNLINQLPSPFILTGDFNAHNNLWGNHSCDARGNILENFINNNNLCLFNDDSHTYLHPGTGAKTSIDLTICSPNIFLDFGWQVLEDLYGSDHYPILNQSDQSQQMQYNRRWIFKKADWPIFQHRCNTEITRECFVNVEDPLTKFTNMVCKIASDTIPKTSPNPKRGIKPWFDDECKQVINERKRALNRFEIYPTMENKLEYKKLQAISRKTIKSKKRKSWQDYVGKITSSTPIKKIWDKVKKIEGKDPPLVKHLKKDGEDVSDIKEISNILGENFSNNSSSKHYSNEFQRKKKIFERENINFNSNNNEEYNEPFSRKELQNALNKAKDTATGPDDLHYQIIKHLPHETQDILLELFNKVWDNGTFPKIWKEAAVIPIPRPSKDHENSQNYRPIALTSCLCKTLERMINDRLVWFLESNNLLSSIQSGFRHNRTTTDHLIKLENFIREGFIRGEHVVSIFFDLEKAYDTTWKYGILKDLRNMGLRGRLPLFIKEFLNNRHFRVRIGGTLSDLFFQEEGVPQGSILSVTLFILKMDSLAKVIKAMIDSSLFVDDFGMSCRGRKMDVVERQLQLNINNVQAWADNNGFKFSKTKTVCIHFCNKRTLHPDPTLRIGDSIIPCVKEARYLGLIFDHKLNFIAHIKHIKNKTQKSLNLLRVLSNTSWGADRRSKTLIYKALIRSKLDYGSIVYGSARPSYLKSLETIQNQALRLCLGAFRTSPVESLEVESGEMCLDLRRLKLSMQYAIKLYTNQNNPTKAIVFDNQNQHLFDNKPNAIKPFGLRISQHLQDANIELEYIDKYSIPRTPSWN